MASAGCCARPGQIPVYRNSVAAADAFRSAVDGVRAGKVVAIFPEGTITRDPDLWPMRGKTGAARVALETRCPLIPVAQWGAQEILSPYGHRPSLFPRKTIRVLAGPPVDLDDLYGRPIDATVLREATDRLMDRITELLEQVRGETRPRVSASTPARTGCPRSASPMRHEDIGRARPTTLRREGHSMTHVAVMGSGNWGTAFAAILADAGCAVDDVGAPGRDGRGDQRRAQRGLPARPRPARQRARHDRPGGGARRAPTSSCSSVPSQTLRDNLGQWGGHIPAGAPVVSLMKGVELGTTMRMSEVIAEAGRIERGRVVVLSGPNLAPEIARKQPAAGVVACSDMVTAERVAAACATPYFRPYTDTDVVGAEVCGATKNVVALASGMAEGMGFGDNTKATIITRGLAETTRLGLALGAHPQTFMGLAGVGDLIATCMSPLSRNHSFGVRLGRGHDGGAGGGRDAHRRPRASSRASRSSPWPASTASTCRSASRSWPSSVTATRPAEVGPRLMSRDLKAEKR